MNELAERALKWLDKFVVSRKSRHAASIELGHRGNWAGRLIDKKVPCNWSYREIAKMADRLGMTPVELEDAIRGGIVPIGRPKVVKPRATPRRAQKARSVQARTNRP